jgi:hypothetical protein|tara:strand:+ start:873 stop:1145 length:273 start_codon:yes stop_codon:yes gene_type:complete
MNTAILIGSAFGAALGLIHAAGLARRIFARSDFAFPGFALGRIWTPLYYGLWTILLWVIFGAYVLYLWLIACGVFGLHRLWRGPLPAGRY